MNRLSQVQVDRIVAAGGTKTEKAIAEEEGVSRWVVHHYLELAGKAGKFVRPKGTLSPPDIVVRTGRFAIYYNKAAARSGYPWAVEGSDGKVVAARSVEVAAPSRDWEGANVWTEYSDLPRRRGGRASYVKGVMMVVGRVVIQT